MGERTCSCILGHRNRPTHLEQRRSAKLPNMDGGSSIFLMKEPREEGEGSRTRGVGEHPAKQT